MVELGLRRPALAIVAVSLPVAAADGKIVFRANDTWLLDASSGRVGDPALTGRVFAPKRLVTAKRGDAVASIPELHRP